MNDIIDKALNEPPDYRRLTPLAMDIHRRIEANCGGEVIAWQLPPGFRIGTVALSLLALLAFSQVSFQSRAFQADIFDLRFFSYQAAPSLNFASVNTYEFTQ